MERLESVGSGSKVDDLVSKYWRVAESVARMFARRDERFTDEFFSAATEALFEVAKREGDNLTKKFVWRAARRRCRTVLKRESLRERRFSTNAHRVEGNAGESSGDNSGYDDVDGGDDVFTSIVDRNFSEAVPLEVADLLCSLSPSDRDLVERHVLAGETLESIAEARGITKSQAYRQFNHALSYLRGTCLTPWNPTTSVRRRRIVRQ